MPFCTSSTSGFLGSLVLLRSTFQVPSNGLCAHPKTGTRSNRKRSFFIGNPLFSRNFLLGLEKRHHSTPVSPVRDAVKRFLSGALVRKMSVFRFWRRAGVDVKRIALVAPRTSLGQSRTRSRLVLRQVRWMFAGSLQVQASVSLVSYLG